MAAPRAWQDVRFFRANSLWMHYGGFAIGVALVLRGAGAGGFLLGLGIGCLSGGLAACAYSLFRAQGPSRFDGDLAYTRSDGRAMCIPYALALGHAFNHPTHHRGQISAALTGMDRPAPELDWAFLIYQETRNS